MVDWVLTFGRIFLLPVLVQRVRDLDQPSPIFDLFTQFQRGKEFDAVGRRIAQWLEQTRRVTLHCYRYAWAERTKIARYPERFAQEALGHNSKAVHRAYAKRALMKIPSLEQYEKAATEKLKLTT